MTNKLIHKWTPVLILAVWLNLRLCGFADDLSKSLPAAIDQLTNVFGQSEEDKEARAEILKALSQKVLPDEVISSYGRQLLAGNVAILPDIAETDGLWSEHYADPLVSIFLTETHVQIRVNILKSFSKHRGLYLGERQTLFAGLRDSGELEPGNLKRSEQFIVLLIELGEPAAVEYLTPLLECDDSVPSGIGLSGPLPSIPPRIRVCDCAHDAIVKLSRGNLNVQIALAYQELGITNRFDPRALNFSTSFVPKWETDSDEDVVLDTRARDYKLFEETRAIRDVMIKNLTASMARAGVR